MDIAEIKDQKSLERWLYRRRVVDAIRIGLRCALRVFPLYRPPLQVLTAREYGSTALPLIRALFTSGVNTNLRLQRLTAHPVSLQNSELVFKSQDLASMWAYRAAVTAEELASISDNADRRAFDMRAGTTAFNAMRASSEVGGASYIWEQVREDARIIEEQDSTFSSPLWSIPHPGWFQQADRETRAIWAKEPPGTWDFWLRWWDGVLSGNQVDWNLQRDIVLELTDEDWEAGPARVAERIAEIEAVHNAIVAELAAEQDDAPASPLSAAAAFDFDFDAALRRLEIIGFTDDMAHLKDPAAVAAFLDDIEEVRDGLQDFQDYADAARNGNNSVAVLSVAAEKILDELKRTKDKTHVRARRIIGLSGDLFMFSTEEAKRNELGLGLCKKLDNNVALLRAVCRKHLAVAIMRLEPLDRLKLGDANPSLMLADLRKAMDVVKAKANRQELAQLSAEAQAVLNDMFNDLETLERALTDAATAAQKANIQDRFVKGYGALAATTGRAVEKAQQHADKPVKWFDSMTRWYRRWETIQNIVDWLSTLGSGGAPPPGV